MNNNAGQDAFTIPLRHTAAEAEQTDERARPGAVVCESRAAERGEDGTNVDNTLNGACERGGGPVRMMERCTT